MVNGQVVYLLALNFFHPYGKDRKYLKWKERVFTLVFRIDEVQLKEAVCRFTIAHGSSHPQDRVSGFTLLPHRLFGRPLNVR